MKRLYWVIFALGVTTYCQAQSPGGVSGNLRWWVKANGNVYTDAGVTPATNGQTVERWNDSSPNANHANQTGGNKPVFQTNVINGNPVLRFAGDQFIDAASAPGISATNSFYYFLVLKPTTYTAGSTSDGTGTYILDRTSNTNNLISLKVANTNRYYLQKRNDDNSGIGGPTTTTAVSTTAFVLLDFYRNKGTEYGIYLNGRQDATSGDDNANLTGPTIRLGRHTDTSNGGLTGDIAELIVYNANLTSTERQRVESYLAIKYGVTMDQTLSKDYLNAAGAVVYPATTTHDIFDFDIAGIGNDVTSGLNQTASQSQNALSMLRISSPSSLSDQDYLIWGHNSPTVWNSTNAPPGYLNRLTRVWRAAETNDVGTVTVSFDLNTLGVNMSDVSKFALLIDSDGDFSDAVAHITGRSVVGNVVSFTLANINNDDYFTLATDLIPGPGGVAGSVSWLRADLNAYVNAGTTLATDGQTIQQWNNQGQSSYNVSQAAAANRPTFRTNQFNSNPVLRFTSAGSTHTFLDYGTMGLASTSSVNYTIVLRPSSNNGGALGDGAGGYIIERNPTSVGTNPLNSFKLLATTKFGLQKRNDSGGGLGGVATTTNISLTAPQIIDYYRQYNVRYGILYNGLQEATLTDTDGQLTIPNLRIGAHYDGDKGFNGDIAEFIVYNRDLTTSERNRIDTYLAIKYGITLNQSVPTDYVASDGAVIYPSSTTHSSFRADIAGIGRDDVSRLTQSSSQSVNANSVLHIQNPSSLGDLDWLVWGSNNGSLTTPNTADVDGTIIKRRLSRIWRMAETNDTGTIDISFDLAAVPGAKVQADLRLLIDRNANGFADNDVAPQTGTLAGSIFTVTGVNLQHNDRITVGTVNAVTTPLPVELVDFTVNYENPAVIASWKTRSELNNAYFTVERSTDGINFEDVETIQGAGTTQETHSYVVADPRPFIGQSYYRLRQVDYDGTFATSEVRAIYVDEQERKLMVYPNPSDGKTLNFSLGNTPLQISHVEIVSQQGRNILSVSDDNITRTDSHRVTLTEQLKAGLYMLKVFYNGKTEYLKLMVR